MKSGRTVKMTLCKSTVKQGLCLTYLNSLKQLLSYKYWEQQFICINYATSHFRSIPDFDPQNQLLGAHL